MKARSLLNIVTALAMTAAVVAQDQATGPVTEGAQESAIEVAIPKAAFDLKGDQIQNIVRATAVAQAPGIPGQVSESSPSLNPFEPERLRAELQDAAHERENTCNPADCHTGLEDQWQPMVEIPLDLLRLALTGDASDDSQFCRSNHGGCDHRDDDRPVVSGTHIKLKPKRR